MEKIVKILFLKFELQKYVINQWKKIVQHLRI